MISILELQDNCRVYYSLEDRLLRQYTFEYMSFNGVKHEIKYDIYQTTIDFTTMYKVKTFMKDDRFFESFDDAVLHVLAECNDIKDELNEHDEELKAFIEPKNE